MVRLKGYELKGVVNFRGHEQEPLMQGNIYKDGKKVGYYSDSFNGGESTIDIYHKVEGEQRFNSKSADEFRGLVEELINMIVAYDFYKKIVKKGRDMVCRVREMQHIDGPQGQFKFETDIKMLAGLYGLHHQKFEDEYKDNKDVRLIFYRKLEDFIVD